MSLKNMKNFVLSWSVLPVMVLAGSVVADAGGNTTDQRPCYDYDRNDRNGKTNGEDSVETTHEDCPGNVPTPEPVSILLFSAGLAGVGFAARRRLRKSE